MKPLQAAIIAIITGAVCLLLPSVATALGDPLTNGTRQALELGGLSALVGGAYGAWKAPPPGGDK